MTDFSKVTPRPWQQKDDYLFEGRTTIVGNVDGEYIDGRPHVTFDFVCCTADPEAEPNEEAVARAALIVEAVNSYDAMKAERASIVRLIPMDYLQRHDAPGATGPTTAVDLVAAMRDYAKDRWTLIERLDAMKARIAELEGALARAGTWFNDYAMSHTAKGDEDKAKRNAARADYCRAALAGGSTP